MEELTKLVSNINSFIWGMYCLIPLLCGVGIYFTIRLKFIQIRKFGQAVRMLFGDLSLKGKRADKHGMSSFQSVATAIWTPWRRNRSTGGAFVSRSIR